ncbi:MAG: hypothetical protein AABY13_06080 [Nanoarchaeota archaeon]
MAIDGMNVDDIARGSLSRVYAVEATDANLAWAVQEELRWIYGSMLAVDGFKHAPTFILLRFKGEDAFPRPLLRSIDYTVHDVDPEARLYVPGISHALTESF